ncbi:MAG: arginase family protein [Desulfurococcales archaeon]|nr:arginase family protein [Desulfurococcales archaeon]
MNGNPELFTEPGTPLLRDPQNESIASLEETQSIALLGIPWDWGITGRPGARLAPQAVRNILYSLKTHSPRYGRLALKPRDLGDVRIPPGDWDLAGKRIVKAMEFAYRNYKHVLVLGGDHSITEWTVKALLETSGGSVGILLLDAHYDMRSVEEGYTSGMWLWNLYKAYGDRIRAAIVGVGDYANPPYLAERAEEAGFKVISAEEVLSDPSTVYEAVEYLEGSSDAYYVSIDMDHLDQAYAPGVNAPSIVGLHPHHTLMLLEEAIPVLRPVAIDLVEVTPLTDVGGMTVRITAYLAAKILHLLENTMARG